METRESIIENLKERAFDKTYAAKIIGFFEWGIIGFFLSVAVFWGISKIELHIHHNHDHDIISYYLGVFMFIMSGLGGYMRGPMFFRDFYSSRMHISSEDVRIRIQEKISYLQESKASNREYYQQVINYQRQLIKENQESCDKSIKNLQEIMNEF